MANPKLTSFRNALLATGAALAACAAAVPAAMAAAPYSHVLLISIDGMHGIDLQNYVTAHPQSALAGLARNGVVYQNAYTTAPSDSFPGMVKSVAGAANLQTIYTGEELARSGIYKRPLHNNKTPDFVGLPYHGTIYTTGTKLAEHGGFSDDDRHVAMVASGATVAKRGVVTAPVLTTQIAPTILTALGLDPNTLKGVQTEHTQILPDVFQ